MIRTYSDKRIYKYFKIALGLSVVSLFIAVVSIVAHACVTFLRIPKPSMGFEAIFDLIFFYFWLAMIPGKILSFSARSLKPIKQNAQKPAEEKKWYKYSESKRFNDFTRTLTAIILSFAPYILLVFYGFLFLCFGAPNPGVWARMCGYMLPSHIFVYIADAFLKNICILIKREWKEDPPEFVIRMQEEKAKKRKEKAKQRAEQTQQKAETERQRREIQCRSLLQTCGMRFFIKYYRQIKTLPLRDVVLSETYSPEEKEERLTAAKQIMDLNLSSVALDTIIGEYGESLESEEIERAKKLLADITPDEVPDPAGPQDEEPSAEPEPYDPYEE